MTTTIWNMEKNFAIQLSWCSYYSEYDFVVIRLRTSCSLHDNVLLRLRSLLCMQTCSLICNRENGTLIYRLSAPGWPAAGLYYFGRLPSTLLWEHTTQSCTTPAGCAASVAGVPFSLLYVKKIVKIILKPSFRGGKRTQCCFKGNENTFESSLKLYPNYSRQNTAWSLLMTNEVVVSCSGPYQGGCGISLIKAECWAIIWRRGSALCSLSFWHRRCVAA